MKLIQITIPLDPLVASNDYVFTTDQIEGFKKLLQLSLKADSGEPQVAMLDQVSVRYVPNDDAEPLKIAIEALGAITCNCCDSKTDAQAALKRILNP